MPARLQAEVMAAIARPGALYVTFLFFRAVTPIVMLIANGALCPS